MNSLPAYLVSIHNGNYTVKVRANYPLGMLREHQHHDTKQMHQYSSIEHGTKLIS
ncbi:hypothetical protein M378DRAFT_166896 [Amanita muscaria Koide BX008]|uniref:Uncharacterized protein n=1 Tax=Amanita muscaria (strain Koide BX008) TaxID=946122 RepID=A0A0C2SEH3_AMAMK|nr:hypothetical protein M378DRAFT_166896 [Amanita muscaria Koide BX008]